MRVPFIVYADFEAFTKPIDTCQSNPTHSFTMSYQKHIPSSFCYYIKCFDDKLYKKDPVIYTAQREEDDVAQIFSSANIQSPKKMIFTEKDKEIFEKSTFCHICAGKLEDDRVRDHCHLTGKFRGAAHNKCNLTTVYQSLFTWCFTIFPITILICLLRNSKKRLTVYLATRKSTFHLASSYTLMKT